MRYCLSLFLILALAGGFILLAADKAAPSKLTFVAKPGNITYDHAAHAKREKNDCKVCHDQLFKQDAKAPLGFKAGMHKPAENAKISCGFCHHPGGKAFETKGNCTNSKCHVKAGTPAD